MTDWFGHAAATVPVEQGKTYRLLIVDDDVEVLRSLTATVRRATRLTTTIVAEAHPERGLDLLRREKFDLVLSDYRMPTMTGVDLLCEAHKLQPECRRILITGYREEDIAREAVEKAHVHGYLLKPWSTKFLGDHIRAVLTAERPKELAVPEALELLHKGENMV